MKTLPNRPLREPDAPPETRPRRFQPYRLGRLALILGSLLISLGLLFALFHLIWGG